MNNQYAVITGAGRGIGAAIAKLLAIDGYNILINYSRSADKANALATEISELHGVKAVAFGADVGKYDEMGAMRDFAEEALGGKCAVLVNNAGYENGKPFLETQPEQYEKLISIDLIGAMNACHLFVPLMVKQGIGCIVTIASTAALMGGHLMVDYSAAKGGQIALTKALARELGQYNISAVCIAPGYVRTDASAARGEGFLERIKNGSPLKRVCTPAEIAEMVSFAVKFPVLTGQTLAANYGTYMH
jgi:NAD(P)-dependent dehydrogenase (short-subunit alcohol dehydrogenase family)